MTINLPVKLILADVNGGQYDTAALCLGFQLGMLNNYLHYMEAMFFFDLDVEALHQADLLAMSHNYAATVVARTQDSARVKFTPLDDLNTLAVRHV
ncbi:hypothetical protein LQ327_08850 [Actinomycetospora endophytica]|uniref:Uncharacterized protein n=1 Tax=Actinomycetospora endophytica TaxID=2291215 RepID=A0ABS8P5T2_9PSEU|nr:hypothetical protein [Actinomycetospora endophytica]MCD2193489.1 hypothetical protein [Actinomycetospora endophytica]